MALTNRFFADAFKDMHRAFSLLDDPSFFNDARRSLGHVNNNLGSLTRHPATDISETADAYEMHVELPGYDKKNIHIDVDDDRTLHLSGSVQHYHEASSEGQKQDEKSTEVSKDTKSPKWWVNERASGSFQRSFKFPAPINASDIKASYENGVLKIRVPKVPNEGRKRIDIN